MVLRFSPRNKEDFLLYGYISKNIQTKLIELYLKNGDGNKILQTEVYQINEHEIKLFTLSHDDNGGFYVVLLLVTRMMKCIFETRFIIHLKMMSGK